MGAPQVTIETITVTRPLKVIAFTCCFITVILMTAATSTADWILAEGWREGLFMQCIEEGAPTPLPFNMDPTVGCSKARSAGYVGLVAAFIIIGLVCDFFGTFLTGLGLRSTDPNKKYKYYRVAIYALVVALFLFVLAAIIYPVSFSKDLAKAPAKDGGVVEPLLRVGDLDFDNDGIIDHLDPDDDNDGLNDDEDPDDDNDGIDDVDDPDDDNDGIPDELDGNPEDFDGDGVEDDEDEDDDNDGSLTMRTLTTTMMESTMQLIPTMTTMAFLTARSLTLMTMVFLMRLMTMTALRMMTKTMMASPMRMMRMMTTMEQLMTRMMTMTTTECLTTKTMTMTMTEFQTT